MGSHPLKVFREAQDPPLTKAKLAALLEVSRALVTRWESGERQPGRELLPRIAERTGIRPAELRPDLVKLLEAQ